jgi:uncharacterized protein (TIGR02145 family)
MALSHNLFSQIILQGIVKDTGLEPVQNAMVEITDQADVNRKFSSFTNEQGQYVIHIEETGVNDIHTQSPGGFNLSQNYPNPFNPSTVIVYELLQPTKVSIKIHNILGQKIKTLFDGFQSNQTGQVVWDGTDDLGQGVSAGVYIYSLNANGIRINKKMLLIDGHRGYSNINLYQSFRDNGFNRGVLKKQLSNQYLLRITANDILTYEQQNLLITGNIVLDITVIRIGTVIDIDGNTYMTVKIGNQWWMAENLKVTHYRNGDPIPNVTNISQWSSLSTGAYCAYANNECNADTCGYLYNWYTVNDIRNIAPTGWHVPTDEEWKILEKYLGMSRSEADDTGNRGTDEGGKLKETGLTHWNSPNTGATNETGFSAIPCGAYDGTIDYFHDSGYHVYFWSSTEESSTNAWDRALSSYYSKIHRFCNYKKSGFSVRLVQN